VAEPRFGRKGAVLTVGTFDGVHLGHRALLASLAATAARLARPSALVTFDPHPLQVLRPADAPRLLTTTDEKVELLAVLPLDAVVFLAFDGALAAFTPERFVEEILHARIGLAHLVVGYDHGFGRDRSGNAGTLRALGARLGFGVDVVEPVQHGGEPVSSSRIRRALEGGDLGGASAMLGRSYGLRGTVRRGDGRGRALGFATANLAVPDEKLLPAQGIYAIEATLPDGEDRHGLLHLGPRPTYPGAAPTVEAHLFDFDGDLYGRSLAVRFCARLRDVQRFPDEAALVRAMEADRTDALRLFEARAGACRQGAAAVE
jgi:riboflavin kinase/FMN adenylyltransferase